MHKRKESFSEIHRYSQLLQVFACLLIIQACSPSSKIAKSNKDTAVNTVIIAESQPDVMPTFPGGESALMDYIGRNVQYPSSAQELGKEGRVVIRFTIDADGSTKNFEIVKSLDPAFDDAAIRTLKNMPKWKPGRKNGINVPVYYTIPILFKLKRP